MTARDITIWTTFVLLLLTLVASAPVKDSDFFLFSLWFYSSWPLLISFVIAKRLKDDAPAFLLLASTIVYGIWYAYALYQALTAYLGVLLLVYAGVMSLPVMIPVWIIVLLMNAYTHGDPNDQQRQQPAIFTLHGSRRGGSGGGRHS